MTPNMKTGPNFNILVVDDHALVREAFATMLRREFPDATVEVTGSCTEALGAARRNNYEVALVDIELGDRSGMELTMELRTLPNPPVVIAVSVHQESTFVSRSMQLGAKAYVAKDAPSSELFDAIRTTRDGRSYISKDLAEKYSQDTRMKNSTPLAHERLSNRELEVMLQIARGKTPKQVASDLCLSPKTVAVHKHNLCCKTGLRTTVDILKYAQTHGLV
jgi:DNA-binding NarL/FixJ family response regulator